MKEINKMLIENLLKNPLFCIIFIIGILGIIYLLINNLKKDKIKNLEKEKTVYKLKPIMTECERNFYNILKKLENEYTIIPQANLASFIEKKTNNRYYNDLFRNIDFAIFDKDLKKVLLLIEINDKTHDTIRRKSRDLKVRKICNDVNLKIITFYTKYPNESEYVLNRVLKELKELTSR